MNFTQHEALSAFGKSEREAFLAARHVRTRLDSTEQSFVLDHLPDDTPNVQKFLTGVCFANKWNDVWQPPSITSISSSQKALQWFVLIAKRYAEQLEAHVKLRNLLNSKMLSGDWDAAKAVLEEHQRAFGPTLWALNWTLLLIEESRGAQFKFEHIKRFEEANPRGYVTAFAVLFGYSTDQTLPDEAFRNIIRRCIQNSGRIKHFLDLLFIEDLFGDWQVSDILDYFEFIPLIDRYELFIRLAAIGLGENNRDALRLGRAAAQLSAFCTDDSLKYIGECANESETFTPIGQTALLLRAWDAFMSSDYRQSLALANDVVIQNPELISAHELVVKSVIYLGDKNQFNGTTPLMLLWQNICNVYLKNENSEDSLSYLQVFGRRFRIPSLTYPLRALHAAHSSHFSDSNVFRRASFAFNAYGPRNFEYGHLVQRNTNYLKRCSLTFPENTTTRFFHALSQGVPGKEVKGCDNIPEIRRYFFGGLAAARRNDYVQGLAYLKHFLNLQKADSKNPLSPFAIEEARRALVDIYRLKGDVVNMQREVVRIYLDRPQSIRRLPIDRIYESCIENRNEASCRVEFPIIANFACEEPHDVYLDLRRFLNAVGADKPTDLLNLQGFSHHALAVLFIKVCTTEVIDSIDVLDSVAKVETERLESLRWVIKSVPMFARLAETEILRLTQNAQLREALQKIEGARVVVNVAALREAAHERFTDAYFRFATQRDLALTRSNDELAELANAISALHVTGEKKVVLIHTDGLLAQKETALKAFIASFSEIRDAFVYSPHFGVEACLSGRIRHGIVTQHIRKPFVEKHLAVLRDSVERSMVERYWESRLYCDSRMQIKAMMEVLFELTEHINAIAEEVKGVWLQSKTETKNPEGLFDYSFTTAQLDDMCDKRMEDVKSVEVFLDRIFDVLLERTRANLSTVKERINVELRERLRTAVDQAIAKLLASPHEFNSLALRNDLTACCQETERICDQMATWFQESDATLMRDASLELVARTAVGMIEQLNPEIRGKYQISVNSSQRALGRHFTSLVHILFFMLDNANRHSDAPKESFHANVIISTCQGQLKFNVESIMQTPESAAAACRKLTTTVAGLKKALDPDKVTKEGGSGFAKIIAAVRYGFKQNDPVVEATHNDKILNISIACDLMGLAA